MEAPLSLADVADGTSWERPLTFHFGSRYPFGHGLIYAEQLFSDLAIENKLVDIQKEIRLLITIRHKGYRAGIRAGQTVRGNFTTPDNMLNFSTANVSSSREL